jgi:hypothetical protein
MRLPDELSPIKIEDEVLAHGFIQIPVVVIFDPELSPGAKATYGALLWYCWRWGGAPSRSVMAEQLGGGLRTIERHFAELERLEYVSTVRLGLGKPNEYIIRSLQGRALPDMPKMAHLEPPKVAHQSRQKGRIRPAKSGGSTLISLDSKESITKPVDPGANRKTSRQALAEAALKKGKTVEEAVAELMRKTSTSQDEAERIVAEVLQAMGKG